MSAAAAVLGCALVVLLAVAFLAARDQPYSVVLFVKSERRDLEEGSLATFGAYERTVRAAPRYRCKVEVRFLVGRGEPLQSPWGKVLVCPSASDEYLDLPLKTWEAMRWCATSCEAQVHHGFLFANSNVRFTPTELLQEIRRLRGAHYWGQVLGSGSQSVYFRHKASTSQRIRNQLEARAHPLTTYPLSFEREVSYCSGRLYFLSREMVHHVAAQEPPAGHEWTVCPLEGCVRKGDDLFEDVMVGRRVPESVERTNVRSVFWERISDEA